LSTDVIVLANYHTETIDIVRLPMHCDPIEEEFVLEPGSTQFKPGFTMLLRLNLPERALLRVNTLSSLYVSATPVSNSDVSRPFTDHSKHVSFNPSPNVGLVRVGMGVIRTQPSPFNCGFFVHQEPLLSLLNRADYAKVVKEAKPGPLYPPIQEQRHVREHGDGLLSGPNVLEWDV
jgi:hypothetical protein